MPELTLDERYSLTRRIMSLLEGWNLGASDILVLLQLPASIKARNLSRYRDAECFPDDPQVNRRLSYLDCTFAWDLTGSKAEYGKGCPIVFAAWLIEDQSVGWTSDSKVHRALHRRWWTALRLSTLPIPKPVQARSTASSHGRVLGKPVARL